MPKAFWRELVFNYSEDVYEPLEDSYLMADALEAEMKRRTFKSILDMGTGCGFLAIIAKFLSPASAVVAVDKSYEAIEIAQENARRNGMDIDFEVSDLFQFVTGKYDLIIFNPPYLRPIKEDVKAKNSGMWADTGVIQRFLISARRYLKPDGIILLLLSSLSDPAILEAARKHWKIRMLAKKDLDFEQIFVFELSPISTFKVV